MISQDTICALSTAPGIGGIAVVRVSGRHSVEIVSSLLSRNLSDSPTHKAHFGYFRDTEGQLLDEVVATVFHAGKSFTGEETVEIACHGSPYIQKRLLEVLLRSGCRLAEPGEFTMRAFLNGRMDLSQAEAVADLISAESSRAHDVAMNQMRGSFSSELKMLREKLINFASLVELELDFAEEDVEFADRTQLLGLVSEVLAYIRRLKQSFELGNALKAGIPVAITGEPNTGKSTLLNQLLGEDRAIVSDIAGTTRDVIEDTLNIDGILFRLIDTAGIRENAEAIEALGIQRTFEKIRQARIVIVLADNTSEQSLGEAQKLLHSVKAEYPGKIVVGIANKSDISEKTNPEFLALSAKTGAGVEELRKILSESVLGDFDTHSDTIVTNTRHLEALLKAEESLEKAQTGLLDGTTGDFVAMDIRQAMFHIGTITGDISTEDLLGNIFSKFCIGK